LMMPVCYGDLSHLMFHTRDRPISEKPIKPDSNKSVIKNRLQSFFLFAGLA